MKISIITVAYNAAVTIEDTLKSVAAQDYLDIEYIVVDGASKDNTVELCKNYGTTVSKLVSEPDNGIYDAMNKGLALATGDVIGILNSDDFYADSTAISRVVASLQEHQTDSVIGNLVMVDAADTSKVVRYYDAGDFHLERFRVGDMPPHPTFFVKREIYDRLGNFNLAYSICADFDLMLRFLYMEKVSFAHLPGVLVHMRAGGISSGGWKATLEVNRQIKASLVANGFKTSTLKVYSKYLRKIWQLVRRP